MARAKQWCFTLNNYDQEEYYGILACILEEDDANYEVDSNRFDYLVIGEEVGENGTPHLQGFAICINRQRLAQMKKMIGNRAHLEKMRGTVREASEYCKKDGKFIERGKIPEQERGKRTDLILAINDYKGGASVEHMLSTYPSQWIQYGKRIREEVNEVNQVKKLCDWKLKYGGDIILRPWQKAVNNLFKLQNDRQVLWIVDYTGGNGKTFLANVLLSTTECQVLSNMKTADFSFAWEGKEFTLFDFERCTDDHFNYQILERAKNGYVYSSKYEGKVTCNVKSKVLCFSNTMPTFDKLSLDRWFIFTLDTDNEGVTKLNKIDVYA